MLRYIELCISLHYRTAAAARGWLDRRSPGSAGGPPEVTLRSTQSRSQSVQLMSRAGQSPTMQTASHGQRWSGPAGPLTSAGLERPIAGQGKQRAGGAAVGRVRGLLDWAAGGMAQERRPVMTD